MLSCCESMEQETALPLDESARRPLDRRRARRGARPLGSVAVARRRRAAARPRGGRRASAAAAKGEGAKAAWLAPGSWWRRRRRGDLVLAQTPSRRAGESRLRDRWRRRARARRAVATVVPEPEPRPIPIRSSCPRGHRPDRARRERRDAAPRGAADGRRLLRGQRRAQAPRLEGGRAPVRGVVSEHRGTGAPRSPRSRRRRVRPREPRRSGRRRQALPPRARRQDHRAARRGARYGWPRRTARSAPRREGGRSPTSAKPRRLAAADRRAPAVTRWRSSAVSRALAIVVVSPPLRRPEWFAIASDGVDGSVRLLQRRRPADPGRRRHHRRRGDGRATTWQRRDHGADLRKALCTCETTDRTSWSPTVRQRRRAVRAGRRRGAGRPQQHAADLGARRGRRDFTVGGTAARRRPRLAGDRRARRRPRTGVDVTVGRRRRIAAASNLATSA